MMNNSQEKMLQVFISYAREDFETAERLYEDFKRAGVKPWLDDKDILVGQNWKVAIDRAIRESKWFCALLSSNSVSKRGYVQRELKTALEIWDTYPDSEIFLLPVRLDDCEPADEKLRDINHAYIFPSYTAGLKKILRVVAPDFVPVEEQPKPLLRNKGIEVSFDEAKRVFKLDEDRRPLTYITNEYVDNGDGTITDNATGLMWKKSRAGDQMPYEDAQAYVKRLNDYKVAGYSDWRLPTVDELLSLMEEEKQSNGFYIDPIFGSEQRGVWSADRESSSGGAGYVSFFNGKVFWNQMDDNFYVRAVRSIQ